MSSSSASLINILFSIVALIAMCLFLGFFFRILYDSFLLGIDVAGAIMETIK